MVEVFLATAGTSPKAHQNPLCHGIEAAKNYQNTWWVTTVAPLSKCRNDPTFNFLRSSAGKVLRYGRLDFGEAGRTDQPQQSTNSQELYQCTHIIHIYIYNNNIYIYLKWLKYVKITQRLGFFPNTVACRQQRLRDFSQDRQFFSLNGWWCLPCQLQIRLPSGKHTKKYGKSHLLWVNQL